MYDFKMFHKFNQLYFSVIQFLHFARKHRIKIKPKDWWKGLLLLICGWSLIALNIVTFNYEFNPPSIIIGFFIQFISGVFFIFILSYFFHIFKNKNFLGHNFLAISKKNERPGSGIISPHERKVLIFMRGFLAVISYIGFELAKIAVGAIDNSIIFSSDALMYALIAMIFLKERYGILEWSGIITAILGILIIGFYDLVARFPLLGLFGGFIGIISSLFMAIILVLTSVIVQHDYPVRVTFYQCLCGLIVSFIVSIMILPWADFTNHEIYNIKYLFGFVQQGIIYSIALICFFKSFYYVSAIVVAISSYTLDIFTIMFSAIFYHELPSIKNGISLILISLGIGILIYAENKKNKEEISQEK